MEKIEKMKLDLEKELSKAKNREKEPCQLDLEDAPRKIEIIKKDSILSKLK